MATRFEKTILGPNDDGRRLDRVVRKALPEVPLSRIYRALRSREIAVNGKRVHADTRVYEGDSLEIAQTLRRPAAPDRAPDRAPLSAAGATGLQIVFESPDLLVVAKERGQLTHGNGSLEERVAAYLSPRTASGISFRPGPVHRLDRNTSGLVIFGASLRGAQAASRAIEQGSVIKQYVALMEGRVRRARWVDVLRRDSAARTTTAETRDTADEERGGTGKRAVTQVDPVRFAEGTTVVLVRIETGRTHQIRAQAALHGHPLVGDRKYGSEARGPYLLHAGSLTTAPDAPDLGFTHLWTPPPDGFTRRLVQQYGDSIVAAIRARLAGPSGTGSSGTDPGA